MRILICEDEPLVAEFYRIQLEMAGHQVTAVASRPAEGLEACRIDRPDVALVDLQLADGLRGEPLIDELAALGIPAIIVSGEARVMRVGTRARGVLRKSPRFREVLRALRLLEWSIGLAGLHDAERDRTAP